MRLPVRVNRSWESARFPYLFVLVFAPFAARGAPILDSTVGWLSAPLTRRTHRLHLLSSPSRHLQPLMPLSSSTVSSYCPSSVIHGYTPHCPLSTIYQSIICVILVTRAVPVHLHLAAALRRFLLFVYYLAYELFYNPLSRLGHGVLVSLGTHGLEL